jgi:hypothetical protein
MVVVRDETGRARPAMGVGAAWGESFSEEESDPFRVSTYRLTFLVDLTPRVGEHRDFANQESSRGSNTSVDTIRRLHALIDILPRLVFANEALNRGFLDTIPPTFTLLSIQYHQRFPPTRVLDLTDLTDLPTTSKLDDCF